jgi:hypothetical protein
VSALRKRPSAAWAAEGFRPSCRSLTDRLLTWLPRTTTILFGGQVGVCVFITAVPNTKLCAWGEEDSGGHVL